MLSSIPSTVNSFAVLYTLRPLFLQTSLVTGPILIILSLSLSLSSVISYRASAPRPLVTVI